MISEPIRLHSRPAALTVLLLGFLAFCGAAPARAADFDWSAATPESQGLSTPALEALWQGLKAHSTTGLLIIRNDRIVFEQYVAPFDARTPHGTASLAKALVGGVSLLTAMSDGRIDPDDLACKYIPQWRGDPLKSKITVRHLSTHTSGIEDAEEGETRHELLTGWKGAFWTRKPDPFTISRDQAPVLFEPGTRESYSNPGMALLSYAITASLKNAPQKDVRTLLKQRIMDPIGVPAREWRIGYDETSIVDGLPLVANWGGASFTARAVARVGRLMLRQGDWEGRQLIKAGVVRRLQLEGLGWWNNRDLAGGRRSPSTPADAFWGAGAGHQILLVIPSLNVIAVRNGTTLSSGNYNDARENLFFAPLMKALAAPPPAAQSATQSATQAPPLSPSPVIKATRWAPPETILRQARQSDNWPLTWGDDGALYTAYGDGVGFEPFIPRKLSLGLARVLGDPPDFHGENIRSASGETTGSGMRGPKASGMLMVDGVLYMLVRNVGNSQLAWSADHGRTWTWSSWKFNVSFGCPTFINFGKNYAGARDGYVYIVSPDAAGAYVPADRFVLARVPRERLRDRAAYEFFTRLGEDRQPLWSRDSGDRGAIFTRTAQCYRSGVTYNPALKRYLWCQVLPGDADKQANSTAGALRIYDAPEPWGPWTTVFETPRWDVNPGESCSFPAKWISEDGTRLHLVFSGDDSFAVRRADLILK